MFYKPRKPYTLYVRGEIFWVRFTLNGLRYQISSGIRLTRKDYENLSVGNDITNKEAEKIAEKIYLKYKDVVINKKLTFDIIVNKFLDLSYFNNLYATTKAKYKTDIKKALIFFQDKDVFNKANLYLYMEYLQKKDSQTRTIKRAFQVLNVIFSHCEKIGFITENPCKNLDFSHLPRTINRDRYLTQEERLKLQNITNKDLVDYIEFAIETGIRKAEQIPNYRSIPQGIKWEHIDFNKKELFIPVNKTGKSLIIPLSPKAIKILEGRINLKVPFPKKPENNGWWKALSEEIITDFIWHDLRRTFATWAVNGWHEWQETNMSSEKIQTWMGHSDIKTTLSHYAKTTLESLKKELKD